MSSKFRIWILTLMAAFSLAVGSVAVTAVAHAQDTPPASGSPSGWDMVKSFFTQTMTPANTPSINETATLFLTEYGKTCWPCTIFNNFSEVVFQKGQQVSQDARAPFTRIIGAVSVVFCLFYLGGGLVAGDASDIARRWTSVWKFLLGAALGTIFLANSFDNMWNWVYGPVMAVPVAIAKEVGGTNSDMLTSIAAGMPCSVNTVSGPSGAAPIMAGMQGVVCGGHRISAAGMAYGFALMNHTNGFWGTITNVLSGLLLMAVFCWIAITFPLRFIDILIRLTIIGVLSPVLVVLAVFKPTRSFVQTAIQAVLHAACLFAFTSIMFSLGASIFSGLLTTSINAMGNGDTTGVQTVVNGIFLIGGGIVFSSMIKMAPALAGEFSGFRGSSGGVGDAIGGAISGATSMVGKGAGAAASAPVSFGKAMYMKNQNAKAIGGKVAEALGKE
jgi:hypothetical protein